MHVTWHWCLCNMNNGRPLQPHLSDISQINLLVVCLHVFFSLSSFIIVVCHTHAALFSFLFFNTVHLLLSAFENCHFRSFCNKHQFYWHYEAWASNMYKYYIQQEQGIQRCILICIWLKLPCENIVPLPLRLPLLSGLKWLLGFARLFERDRPTVSPSSSSPYLNLFH